MAVILGTAWSDRNSPVRVVPTKSNRAGYAGMMQSKPAARHIRSYICRSLHTFPNSDTAAIAMSFPCHIRLLSASLVIMLAGGCAEFEGQSKAKLQKVQVARPLVREVNDYQYFIGRSQAVQSVELQAKVTGFLWAIDFLHGTQLDQDVKKDQRLFQIDPRPYKAAYDQAVGQLNLAKARLTLAIADYKRALDVAKTPGAISQQDVDKYAASEAEARAEVTAQEANVEAAKLNVEFTDIKAPFDGRVSRNLVDLKDLVKQNETLLATVVTEDPIYVYVDIDDQTMLQVKRLMQQGIIKTREEGGKFPIDIGLSDEGDDYPHRGDLDYVGNQLDPTTGTLQIRGVFENPRLAQTGPRLMEPAQFVRVRFSLGPKFKALLVPQEALGTDQDKKYLLVVTKRGNEENVVEYRPVRVGQEEPGGLQVVFPMPMVKTEKGLEPAPMGAGPETHAVPSITAEDRVIINGLQFAPRGKQVEPTLVPIKVPESAAAEASQQPKATDAKPAIQPSAPAKAEGRDKFDDRDKQDGPAIPEPAAQGTPVDKAP